MILWWSFSVSPLGVRSETIPETPDVFDSGEVKDCRESSEEKEHAAVYFA